MIDVSKAWNRYYQYQNIGDSSIEIVDKAKPSEQFLLKFKRQSLQQILHE
jgi:hypothetical protein